MLRVDAVACVAPVTGLFGDDQDIVEQRQRGTNENTNGPIRQYFPKGKSMAKLTRKQRDAIAHKLNTGPRKRYDYETPDQRIRA